jgi:hypothetical protein
MEQAWLTRARSWATLSVFSAGSGWYWVGVLDAAAKAEVAPTDTAAATSSARTIEVMDGSPEMKSRSALRIGLAVQDQGRAANRLKKL